MNFEPTRAGQGSAPDDTGSEPFRSSTETPAPSGELIVTGAPDLTAEPASMDNSAPVADSVSELEPPTGGSPVPVGAALDSATSRESRITKLPPLPPRESTSDSLHRLTWSLLVLASILMMMMLVPYFVRRVSYSWNLGKQQAEYEVATDMLRQVKFNDLSTLVSKRVGPSVVHINVSGNNPALAFSGGPRPFQMQRPLTRGQGSGVIVDKSGYILTNQHVIHDAQQIQVSLSDRRIVPAEIVGTDGLTDIAVLKVNTGDDLLAAEWADSDELEVGATVWALGSPFGLDRSVTFGIVSAKHRRLTDQSETPHKDYLQTDAAVNPGNSGGPLVDGRGRVVGITTAIVGESYQGISFAVPSNVARRVFEEIRAHGRFDRGFLGVMPGIISQELAQELRLPFADEVAGEPQVHSLRVRRYDTHGAYIRQVSPNTPAHEAGLREGDVIRAWNGKPVEDYADLYNAIGNAGSGKKATMEVYRDGQTIQLEVVLGSLPERDEE